MFFSKIFTIFQQLDSRECCTHDNTKFVQGGKFDFRTFSLDRISLFRP
jgi:hypothetical protein